MQEEKQKKKRCNRKSRSYVLTNKMVIEAGGLLATDEVFLPFPNESAVWISNYGRILSGRHKKAKILKPFIKNGYHKIRFCYSDYGKIKRKSYLVHRVVAELFVPIGDWIHSEDIDTLQVHHIKAVDRDNPAQEQDYASNLQWVPKQLHHAIDKIHKIQVQSNGEWRQKNFVKASKMLGVSPYQFFGKICGANKELPLSRDRNGWEYYSFGSEQSKLCRIKRKENKKSKK
ncbi:MAG: hypothetical protein LUG99_22770 [Lachnospiraceae bacterium]|nr:hypothetical protein [Lachnospiraceae bacterium]